jgi:transcriptional regulator with XRE-family HTH domain
LDIEVLAVRLRELRDKRFLTVRELADEAGVSDDVIYKIENGHRGARRTTVRKLAQALGVEPQDLLAPKAQAPTSPAQAEDEDRRSADQNDPTRAIARTLRVLVDWAQDTVRKGERDPLEFAQTLDELEQSLAKKLEPELQRSGASGPWLEVVFSELVDLGSVASEAYNVAVQQLLEREAEVREAEVREAEVLDFQERKEEIERLRVERESRNASRQVG